MWKKVRVVLLIVLSIVVFVLSGYYSVNLLLVKREVIIPSVTGEVLETATSILRKRGLKVHTEYSKTYDYPDSTVFYQHPKHGQKVLRGFPVKLYVSQNDDTTVCPDLTGLDLSNANMSLMRMGLKVGRIIRVKGRVNLKDQIIFQSPDPFDNVRRGSEIDIYINDGVMKKHVIVPYLLNNDLNYISSISEDMGLSISASGDISGTVVFQGLVPGSVVRPGTIMVLEIQKGLVSSQASEIGINRIIPLNTDYGFYNLNFTLPNYFGTKRVKVVLHEGRSKKTILSEKLKGGDRINKLIKHSEKIVIKIYLGGILIKELRSE